MVSLSVFEDKKKRGGVTENSTRTYVALKVYSIEAFASCYIDWTAIFDD
jgi:hypothetical protein